MKARKYRLEKIKYETDNKLTNYITSQTEQSGHIIPSSLKMEQRYVKSTQSTFNRHTIVRGTSNMFRREISNANRNKEIRQTKIHTQ